MKGLIRLTLSLVLIATAGEPALAQVAQYHGFATDDWFGHAVASGRVNRDRFEEIVIGAREADPGGLADAGSVYVYSDRDGELLLQLNGQAAGDRFGWSVAVCDVNRDGFGDLVIGAPFADPNGLSNAGSVYVYSGRNFQLLRRLDGKAADDLFGYVLACCDVNRDKREDLIVSAPTADPNGLDGAGSVYVYSGRNFKQLRRFDGEATKDILGYSVACGDVNGDGFPDIAVGAPHNSLGTTGKVFVYSGKTGGLLRRLEGTTVGDAFGWSLALGDVNRDKRNDLVVGAPGASPGGRAQAGSVLIYSGKGFALRRRLDGLAAADVFGHSVLARDLNRDGRADLVIGSPGADPGGLTDAGSVLVYSGRNFLLAKRLDGRDTEAYFGLSLACGRVNWDKQLDIIVGAPRTDVFGLSAVGSVAAFSGRF